MERSSVCISCIRRHSWDIRCTDVYGLNDAPICLTAWGRHQHKVFSSENGTTYRERVNNLAVLPLLDLILQLAQGIHYTKTQSHNHKVRAWNGGTHRASEAA